MLTIDNRDTLATIDTYQTFTGDLLEDQELDCLSEQAGKELTCDDIEWDYNHPAIVKGLAEASLEVVREAIKEKHGLDVPLVLLESGSPK